MDCDENVHLQSFEQEFQKLTSLIRDRQTANEEMGHFGTLGLRFWQLALKMEQSLQAESQFTLQVAFGEKLLELKEYTLGIQFFNAAIALFENSLKEGLKIGYLQCMYGKAMCQHGQVLRRDFYLRFPDSLLRMENILAMVQKGMQMAIDDGKSPMIRLGFGKEIVPYLTWCVLALEAVVEFSTTKYLAWRNKFYFAIVACYETIANQDGEASFEPAIECADRAVEKLKQLRKEEKMDAPVPDRIRLILESEEEKLVVLQFKCKKGIAVDKAMESLNKSFDSKRSQVLAIIDILDMFNNCNNEGIVQSLRDCIEELRDCISPDGVANSIGAVKLHHSELDALFSIEDHITILETLCLCKSASFGWFLQLAEVRLQFRTNEAHYQDTLLQQKTFMLRLYDELQHAVQPMDTWEKKIGMVLEGSQKWFKAEEVESMCNSVTSLLDDEKNNYLCLKADTLLEKLSLMLWNTYGKPLLADMDTTKAATSLDVKKVNTCKIVLHSIFAISLSTHIDDEIMMATVGFRLGKLYLDSEKFEKAARILRTCSNQLKNYRNALSSIDTNMSQLSGHRQNFTLSTFSSSNKLCGKSDAPIGDDRDMVGVAGTGSQFGTSLQELQLIQIDVTCLLFEAELKQDKHSHDTSKPKSKKLSVISKRIIAECRKCPYAKCLLSAQRAINCDSASSCEGNVLDSINHLKQAAVQEEYLIENAIQKPEYDKHVLAPLRVISRNYCSISLEIPELVVQKEKKLKYISIYGKAAGAGTDVSLNNCEFPGTGVLYQVGTKTVTISRLVPHENYVFAFAVHDSNGNVLGNISQTSIPACSTCPLPIPYLWGYIAKICQNLNLHDLAHHAAIQVYTAFVSEGKDDKKMWQSNPCNKYAMQPSICATTSPETLELFVYAVFLLLAHPNKVDSSIYKVPQQDFYLPQVQLQYMEMAKQAALALEAASQTENYPLIIRCSSTVYHHCAAFLRLQCRRFLVTQVLATILKCLEFIPQQFLDESAFKLRACASFELVKLSIEARENNTVQYLRKVILDTLVDPSKAGAMIYENSLMNLVLQAFPTSTKDLDTEHPRHTIMTKIINNPEQSLQELNPESEFYLEAYVKAVKIAIQKNANKFAIDAIENVQIPPPLQILVNQLVPQELLHFDEVEGTTPSLELAEIKDQVRWLGELYFLRLLVEFKLLAASSGTIVENMDKPNDDGVASNCKDEYASNIFRYAAVSSLLYAATQSWICLQTSCEYVWNTIWFLGMKPAHLFEKSQISAEIGVRHSHHYVVMTASSLLEMLETQNNFSKGEASQPRSDWAGTYITFALKVLEHGEKWQDLVEMGDRLHKCIYGLQSESFLPIVLEAQQRLWKDHSNVVQEKQTKLKTFVSQFEEMMAKKNSKRKARLRIEKVVTEEEKAFNQKREILQREVLCLENENRELKQRVDEFRFAAAEVQRTKYTCLESLNHSQKLIKESTAKIPDESLLSPNTDIEKSYYATVQLCRLKRDTLLTCQALQELGDYQYFTGDLEKAASSWHDGVDAIFGSLHAAENWKSCLESIPNLTETCGVWSTLMCINLLGKLCRYYTKNKIHQRIQLCKFGAALCESVYSCSISHPSRLVDFATYSPKELWPLLDVFQNEDQIQPMSTMLSVKSISSMLIDYDLAAEALPAICMYEYLAKNRLRCLPENINARRLKCKACVKLGFISESIRVLNSIHKQSDTPYDNLGKDIEVNSGDPTEDNEQFKNNSRIDADINPDAIERLLNIDAYKTSILVNALGSSMCLLLDCLKIDILVHIAMVSQVAVSGPSFTKKIVDLVQKHELALKSSVNSEQPLILAFVSNIRAYFLHTLAKLECIDQNWGKSIKYCLTALSLLLLAKRSSNKCSRADLDDQNLNWMKCRTLIVEASIMQVRLDFALDQANSGLEESTDLECVIYSNQFKVLQARILCHQGCQNSAKTRCHESQTNDGEKETLKADMLSMQLNLMEMVSQYSEQDRAETEVEVNAITSNIDGVLQQEGWIGHHEEPLHALGNLYSFIVPTFLELLLRKLQGLEISLANSTSMDIARIDQGIEWTMDGLATVPHMYYVPPNQVPALLCWKGLLICKKFEIILQGSPGQHDAHKKLLDDGTTCLVQAMEQNISSGLHDFNFLYIGCMSLVKAYSQAFSLSLDVEYRNRYAFYLKLASDIHDKQRKTWSQKLNFLSQPLTNTANLLESPLQAIRNMAVSEITHQDLFSYYLALKKEYLPHASTRHESIVPMINIYKYLCDNVPEFKKECCVQVNSIQFDAALTLPSDLVCAQWLAGTLNWHLYYYISPSENRPDCILGTKVVPMNQLEHISHQASQIRRQLDNKICKKSMDKASIEYQNFVKLSAKTVGINADDITAECTPENAIDMESLYSVSRGVSKKSTYLIAILQPNSE